MTWSPKAPYIGHPDQRTHAQQVLRYRRSFSGCPTEALRVSAYGRFKVWLDGRLLARGPLKGTLVHRFYESIDLPSLCSDGEHVLAVELMHFGAYGPMSEVHPPVAGLVAEGAGLDTGPEWKVQLVSTREVDMRPFTPNAHLFIGGTQIERDLSTEWLELGYDDGGWAEAVEAWPSYRGGGEAWPLHEREIPPLREEPVQLGAHWSVPANEPGEWVLDAGALMTGYPLIELEGGRGRTVELIYCEAPWHRTDVPDDGTPYYWGTPRLCRRRRDDTEVAVWHGYRDSIYPDGGVRSFEPFHWRTFRYLCIRVSPGHEPLTIRSVAIKFTSSLPVPVAWVSSPLPDGDTLWDISLRTLALCSHETYEDCPYYEQLNYCFDSRNELLTGLWTCGARDMARRTIRLLRDSARPDGMLSSRPPTEPEQTIPYFTLSWIEMLNDLWEWGGPAEADFLRSCLPVADGVLAWFRRHQLSDGWIGALTGWNPVGGLGDAGGGLQDAIDEGRSTFINAYVLYALRMMQNLHQKVGHPEDAVRWEPFAASLLHVVESAWSPHLGRYLERPGVESDRGCRHTQSMAILSGVRRRREELADALNQPGLVPMTRQHGLHLAESMDKVEDFTLWEREVLPEYRAMVDLGLTTWLEGDPDGRSDCHAWSAWLPVAMLRYGVGIRPSPGFQEYALRPTMGWSGARAVCATPNGPIDVAL